MILKTGRIYFNEWVNPGCVCRLVETTKVTQSFYLQSVGLVCKAPAVVTIRGVI